MPLTTAVVLLSLAVGIGVNTAIFSWIQAVILRAVARHCAERQLPECRDACTDTGNYPGVAWSEYKDLCDRVSSFGACWLFEWFPSMSANRERPNGLMGCWCRGTIFRCWDCSPHSGGLFNRRTFHAPGVSLWSLFPMQYWQTRFDGSLNAVGQKIRVNNYLLTVVGVTPKRFQGTVLGLDFSLWTPATLAPVLLSGSTELVDRSQRGYAVMGLLRPGQSHTAAQTELNQAMKEFASKLSRNERECPGRDTSVLAFAPRPATDVGYGLGGAAGDHAAAASGGVRQYRDFDAGASDGTTARDRRASGDGGSTMACGEPAIYRKFPARLPWCKRGRIAGYVGHASVTRGADYQQLSDTISDEY